MRTSYRFFMLAGTFGLVLGTVYWFVAYERAGTALLLLMGIAALVIGAYLFAKGRSALAPEDDPDATYAGSAGRPIGHFSAGSIWPLAMGIGVIVGLEGFVYGNWLLFFGLLLFLVATIGLMQESRG